MARFAIGIMFCAMIVVAHDGRALADTILYQDDFSGSSANSLNGAQPDIRPGSELWVSSNLIKADGSVPIAAGGGGNFASAFLPFVPIANRVYTFSIDVNPTSALVEDPSDWFAVGFTQGATTTIWHGSPNNAYGWILNRFNDASTSAFQTFQGPATAGTTGNHNPDPDMVGVVSLKIVLDTTVADRTVSWYANNTLIRTATIGTNPLINYIGIATHDSAIGTFDNLSLSVVPEPSAWVLAGISAAALLLVRWNVRRHVLPA